MDRSTVIGFLVGIAAVVYGIKIEGSLRLFWHLPAALIVFGGTFAAVLVSYRVSDILQVGAILRQAFVERREPLPQVVETMVALADKARRNGFLSLEEDAARARDPFLARGLRLLVNGHDANYIRDVLAAEILYSRDRHRIGQGIFELAGALAPAFGLCGTLIGMIQMLSRLHNPQEVGPAFATAMVCTFYGVVSANLLFLPIAGKLRLRSQEETVAKELMLEGILAMASEEHPVLVQQKLTAALREKEGVVRREAVAGRW
ncbi:chemotaxis protein MotA [Thermanaeromonas toyohensis ToBE]|uniref:Chemotaxis protein MotA n=1 Tax=Thermanaeromonas toyohensis ToBE TaxID=698762 RepID=A0A1W1VTJ3_9FIRM|nr:MotA/TolQ/ExbB proton channel family protein [Thermanaeromonas toyohensis]SMB96593.1 chemotaxis protein MotA [Thermanaeromonas toyohensis ToBE]